jgi:hypothetical protein
MIVVVEKGLENVKQYLENLKKYEVKSNDDYVGCVDAYVFSHYQDVEEMSTFENNIQDITCRTELEVTPGVLIINAAHKTPKEIEEIIDQNLKINMWH